MLFAADLICYTSLQAASSVELYILDCDWDLLPAWLECAGQSVLGVGCEAEAAAPQNPVYGLQESSR